MKFPWSLPTALELAAEELAEAQRELLRASSAAEYADAMVAYHTARIERLRGAIRELTAESITDPCRVSENEAAAIRGIGDILGN